MPYPHHDSNWRGVAEFLFSAGFQAEPLTAPPEFNELVPVVYTYGETFADPPPPTSVVILHKGKLNEINPVYLGHVFVTASPTFANDVFVVYTPAGKLPIVSAESVHLRALHLALESLPPTSPAHNPLGRPAQPSPAFSTNSVDQVRTEMNRRYERAEEADPYCGYEHPYLWDRVRFEEVDRVFVELLGSTTGLRVLEIGCGMGRNVHMVAACREYLGVDLSDVAIKKAQVKFADRPNYVFRSMNAMDLDLPDAAVDLVLGVEIIEHVQDAERMLREISRVLVPGGRFVFNSANRDSLHLRLVRLMGLPEFRSTHEHFREFGFAEMGNLLAQVGLEVESSAGIFLHPYRNVPLVEPGLREMSETNPELVNLLRELGRRAGAEFGYEFAISAQKK